MAGEWEVVGGSEGETASVEQQQPIPQEGGWEEVGAAPKVSALEKGIGNVAAVLDMPLSLPGQAVGLGAEVGARVIGALSGEPRREAAKEAQAIGQRVSEALGNPVQKLMKSFGYGEGYEQSDVASVMAEVSKLIGRGGEGIEKLTGGVLLKEDFESLANEAMLIGGPQMAVKATKLGWKKMTGGKVEGVPGNYEEFKSKLGEGTAADAVKPDLAEPLEFERIKIEPKLEPADSPLPEKGLDYSQHAAEQRSAGMEERAQAADRARKELSEWEQEVTEIGERKAAGSGVGLTLDPVTNRFRADSAGLRGATPDTITSTGNTLASAAEKITAGKQFDLTAQERVAWRHHQVELARVAEAAPEFEALSPAEVLSKMQDREWVQAAADKAKQMREMWNTLESSTKDAAAKRHAQAKKELLEDSLTVLEDKLRVDRPKATGTQGQKTLAAKAAGAGLLTASGIAAAGAGDDSGNGGLKALLGVGALVAGAKLIKPLKAKFSEVSPKAKYVAEMVQKFGPEFSRAAEYHWDQTNKMLETSPKIEGQGITVQAGSLEKGQYTLAQQKAADKIRAKQFIKQLSPEEFRLASSEELYNARPEERMRTDRPLPPELQSVKERVIDPLVKRVEELYEEAVELGGAKELADLDPHNIRSTKRSWLQKVSRFGQDAFPSGGFARKAGTMKDRSMFGLEFPDGSIKVVHQDGQKLVGFGPDRKPLGVIARTPEQLKVGQTIEFPRGKAKLVQAPTRLIEQQTGIEYNKNVLANYLSAEAELKAYIREKRWLAETVKGLEGSGLAIKASKVSGAPKGYTRLQGENTLERYYIQDRLANTFEDGILKSSSPVNLLERVNTAAVGTMFWNPAPHLYNAFDHWINSVGWDLINPMQYKSIAKSTYEAFRDVSQLTPEYLKMLDNGFGLQYGRVAAEGVLEGVIKGIPESSWKSIAQEWGYGMNPGKLISDIYKGSKHILWGGSDVMMISAYRHLASKKGVDIFNKALGDYVETHNPNYRIPANIGFDALTKIPGMSEALAQAISRQTSKIMQSRAFNTFGRYHYGQFKSLGANVKDLLLQNADSVQSRGEAAGHLAFTAFSLGVVYPYIWDTIAKTMSGDPQAQQRRAGAATIPYTIWHMALGDEKVTKLLSEAFSIPPITKAIVEGASNRQLFTGKHIWEPEDNGLGKLNDVGIWATGVAVAPLRDVTEIASGKKTLGELAASQAGIKLRTEEKAAKLEQFKKREAAMAKRRQAKRGYFEDER